MIDANSNLKTLSLYYTMQEIRDIVFDGKISVTTIQAMVKRKEIPSVRVSNRIYIPQYWVKQKIEEALGKSI